jgi:protein TonB
MLPAPPSVSTYDGRLNWRSRVAALLLSLGFVTLFALVLVWMGLLPPPTKRLDKTFTAVEFAAPAAQSSSATAETQQAKTPIARPTPPQPRPIMPPPPPLLKSPPVQFTPQSHDDVATFDLSKMPQSSAGSGSSGGRTGGSVYGPGEGPGGIQLVNAEWYREPSHAELAGYLKSGAPAGSWATIACQTAAQFHVENCQQLDEFPRGSGLSRSLRQAAWQFLVRPPRKNGQAQLGAWVRIRFDFRAVNEPRSVEQPDE